jgi:hypothetical protein
MHTRRRLICAAISGGCTLCFTDVKRGAKVGKGIIALVGIAAVGAYTLGRNDAPKPLAPAIQYLAPVAPPAPVANPSSPPSGPSPPVTKARYTQQPLSLALPAATSSSPPPSGSTKQIPTIDKKGATETALTAAAIAAILVAASRQAYYAGGRPCACPDDRMRNGRSCGSKSAYSRPGGAAPLCYPHDVSAAMIEQYKSKSASR